MNTYGVHRNTYGYIRVSSVDQNEDRQVIAMGELKIPPENIFMDKLSGKDTKRPQLKALMEKVKPGDTVIVESISRFARNTRDLLDLVEQLAVKGVEFIGLKENIDTSTPTGKFNPIRFKTANFRLCGTKTLANTKVLPAGFCLPEEKFVRFKLFDLPRRNFFVCPPGFEGE